MLGLAALREEMVILRRLWGCPRALSNNCMQLCTYFKSVSYSLALCQCGCIPQFLLVYSLILPHMSTVLRLAASAGTPASRPSPQADTPLLLPMDVLSDPRADCLSSWASSSVMASMKWVSLLSILRGGLGLRWDLAAGFYLCAEGLLREADCDLVSREPFVADLAAECLWGRAGAVLRIPALYYQFYYQPYQIIPGRIAEHGKLPHQPSRDLCSSNKQLMKFSRSSLILDSCDCLYWNIGLLLRPISEYSPSFLAVIPEPTPLNALISLLFSTDMGRYSVQSFLQPYTLTSYFSCTVGKPSPEQLTTLPQASTYTNRQYLPWENMQSKKSWFLHFYLAWPTSLSVLDFYSRQRQALIQPGLCLLATEILPKLSWTNYRQMMLKVPLPFLRPSVQALWFILSCTIQTSLNYCKNFYSFIQKRVSFSSVHSRTWITFYSPVSCRKVLLTVLMFQIEQMGCLCWVCLCKFLTLLWLFSQCMQKFLPAQLRIAYNSLPFFSGSSLTLQLSTLDPVNICTILPASISLIIYGPPRHRATAFSNKYSQMCLLGSPPCVKGLRVQPISMQSSTMKHFHWQWSHSHTPCRPDLLCFRGWSLFQNSLISRQLLRCDKIFMALSRGYELGELELTSLRLRPSGLKMQASGQSLPSLYVYWGSCLASLYLASFS